MIAVLDTSAVAFGVERACLSIVSWTQTASVSHRRVSFHAERSVVSSEVSTGTRVAALRS